MYFQKIQYTKPELTALVGETSGETRQSLANGCIFHGLSLILDI